MYGVHRKLITLRGIISFINAARCRTRNKDLRKKLDESLEIAKLDYEKYSQDNQLDLFPKKFRRKGNFSID